MKKVRIALIGIGHDHFSIFNNIKRKNDLFEIAGYAIPEEEKGRFDDRLYIFDGIKELSIEEIMSNPEIEAVSIETEEVSLTKYALIAAENKKHIQMDKPGGLSLDEFEKLIKTVKANGTLLHLGYMYRYNPYISDALDRIKRGELGEIFSVEAQMNCAHLPEKRQWLSTFKGGMMFFLGCHLVDLILQIQGTPLRVIPLNKCTGTDGVTAEDFGMAVFEYPTGVSFAKTNANELGGLARRQLVITGSKGTIEIKPLEITLDKTILRTEKTEYSRQEWTDRGVSYKSEPFDRYNAMLDAFAKMVNGEIKNPYTPDYELELYKNILKACGV